MPIVIKLKKGKTKDDLIGEFRRVCMEEEIKEKVESKVAFVKRSEKKYRKNQERVKLNKKARRRAAAAR